MRTHPCLRWIPSCALLLAAAPAFAVPVTPVVVAGSELTSAFTIGIVPGAFDLDVEVDPLTSNAAATATNGTEPAESDTAEGAGRATLDATDINLSTVGARSAVSTGAAGSPLPASPTVRDMADLSFGALGATLSTVDLAPGDSAEVDLTLNFDGSIIYSDATGSAGVNVESVDAELNPTFIPDISGSVSVLMDLSNLVTGVPLNPDGSPDLASLPFVPLFNGSLTLESTDTGAGPSLTSVGDFDLLDFTILPGCDAFFCQVDVAMSRTFNDVQSLGLDDVFEIGLFVFTDAQSVRGPGRSIDVDFMNTASVNVAIATADVPAPAALVLLLTGLVGLRVMRRA